MEARDELVHYAAGIRTVTADGLNPYIDKVEQAARQDPAWREAAGQRARTAARRMLAGLMPGNTGINMADEIADKVLAAAFGEPDEGSGECPLAIQGGHGRSRIRTPWSS